MVPAPPGYTGKTYIKGLYVYEHRLLMEQKLGRLLSQGEVVHHLDGNKQNNSLGNLSLTSRALHTAGHNKPVTMVKLKCSLCGKEFERELRNYSNKAKRGQKNFYCSRKHQHESMARSSMVEQLAVEKAALTENCEEQTG